VTDPSLEIALQEAAAISLISYPGSFSGNERFELQELLGEGGFGVVFRAIDHRQKGAPVALKLLRRPYAERLYRFKREFRSLSELRHRNLVGLHELVASGKDVFFTMELIDGQPLQSYVSARRDELRNVLRQLAEGLSQLHRAGKLHRDVKPSNILVEKGGRVVLLDFGLAVELDARDTSEMAGTPLYMSPEQCAAAPLGEASDWYAVGLVLFELLTGRLPFQGDVMTVMHDKQSLDVPRASTLAADVPADLDDLCAALLRRDPARRAGGDEILRCLNAAPEPASPPRQEPFVGRAAELALLSKLFDEATEGAGVVALARGPSGIGKSALLRQFLDELRRRRPEAVALAGRCYEMESVPYKALDAVVDELARWLRRLPDVEAAALLPREPGALTKLFPVLRQVPAFSLHSDVGRDGNGDARGRGMMALRELFSRLADRRPVVVCVDDLQWGDVDSATLLAELARPPDPPAVLWLGSFREEEAATSPMLRRLNQLRGSMMAEVRIHELKLGGLDGAEARELAASLLGGDSARAGVIAAESRGSPFFVQELARAGCETEHALGELVRQRVAGLDGGARNLLEVLAVAACPLDPEVMAIAAGADGDLREPLGTLRAARLIRARESQNDEKLIESYHDRIREAVVAAMPPAQLTAIHMRLAAALERAAADPAQIGHHLAAGGDPARAQGYLVRAAEEAQEALAFDHAARLYRRALELQPEGGDSLELELSYAEVLSVSGRGAEAARLWLAMAERVSGEQALDLRRRAAEGLIQSGFLDEGYTAMSPVLKELGLSIPRSDVGAFARIGYAGLHSLFHGRPKLKPGTASARELLRVDVLCSLTWALSLFEQTAAFALQKQHLRLALRSGDPARAAQALAVEAMMTSLKEGTRSRGAGRRLLDEARALIGSDPSHSYLGAITSVEGVVALMEGRWLEGLHLTSVADEKMAVGMAGHGSMRGMMYALRMNNLFWLGRSGETLRAIAPLIRDLEDRSHLAGWIWLKLIESWALGCNGHLEAAWAANAQAAERMAQCESEVQRWYLGCGQAELLLLEGKADEAWKRAVEAERRVRIRLTGQSQRVPGVWVRAMAALARALQVPAERREMIAEAQRMARRLEKEGAPWIDAIAHTMRACIASVSGDEEGALRLLTEAESLLETHHVESALAAARLARGRIIGGDTGRELIARAEAWIAQENTSPALMRALLPGTWTQ
jgi:predicted Ser/Thr protein kinase